MFRGGRSSAWFSGSGSACRCPPVFSSSPVSNLYRRVRHSRITVMWWRRSARGSGDRDKLEELSLHPALVVWHLEDPLYLQVPDPPAAILSAEVNVVPTGHPVRAATQNRGLKVCPVPGCIITGDGDRLIGEQVQHGRKWSGPPPSSPPRPGRKHPCAPHRCAAIAAAHIGCWACCPDAAGDGVQRKPYNFFPPGVVRGRSRS